MRYSTNEKEADSLARFLWGAPLLMLESSNAILAPATAVVGASRFVGILSTIEDDYSGN
jgi:hypothetical protein